MKLSFGSIVFGTLALRSSRAMRSLFVPSPAKQLPALAIAVYCLGTLEFITAAVAKAPFNCDVSQAAGKSAPPQSTPYNPEKFRILWHIATQIEDLADAGNKPKAMADIREAQRLVDGYFINVLMAGALIYWPDRPKICGVNFRRIEAGAEIDIGGDDVNFKEGGLAERAKCKQQQDEFLARQPADQDSAAEIQSSALERVLQNLALADEQRKGKTVVGVNIIRNTNFSYDAKSDKAVLTSLPTTYCALNALGITPNDVMLYQAPSAQEKKGNLFRIPRKDRSGKLVYSKNARKDKFPDNPHALELIAAAFRDASMPPTGIRVNFRRTPPRQASRMFRSAAGIPTIVGFNFEGGPNIVDSEKRTLDNYVENMSWLLQNTRLEISMLMPGYRPREGVGSDDELDGRVAALRSMLLTFNTKLGAKLGLAAGKNALCDGRIVLIPSSYGRPLHVRTLPMRRDDGRLAGTVTGQIRMLSDLRTELCGT